MGICPSSSSSSISISVSLAVTFCVRALGALLIFRFYHLICTKWRVKCLQFFNQFSREKRKLNELSWAVVVPPAAAAAVRDLLDPFGTRQIGNLVTWQLARMQSNACCGQHKPQSSHAISNQTSLLAQTPLTFWSPFRLSLKFINLKIGHNVARLWLC